MALAYFTHAIESSQETDFSASIKFQLALCHKLLGLQAMRATSKIRKKRNEIEENAKYATSHPDILPGGSYAQIEMKLKVANIRRKLKNVFQEEEGECKEALRHLESGVDRSMEAITDLENAEKTEQGSINSISVTHHLFRYVSKLWKHGDGALALRCLALFQMMMYIVNGYFPAVPHCLIAPGTWFRSCKAAVLTRLLDPLWTE